ncbi:MAG: divergent PAP2 family protein [Dehalococcoidia bacterium]|nr:MAG: divergent PAP2 family protein [Dehalococcoidia bacterium]
MLNTVVNETLLIATTSWLVAQLLKVVGGLIREKRLDMSFFIRSGGMPSSHTALVTSLATSVGILLGFNSVEFAISTVFASIVMYDAAGVRRSVGQQSIILNRILRELRERRPKDMEHDVRELIGHTPFQVFSGAILGIGIAVVWLWWSGKL